MATSIKGLSFPLKFGPLGHLSRASGAEKIAGNMKNIILTRVEDRETAPGLGTLGFSSVMRNIDQITFALLEDVLGSSLALHENRAIVRDISFEEGAEPGQLQVTILFSLRDTGEFSELTALLE